MIISLEKDYQSSLLFQPIVKVSGALLGVEVIANFSSREGDIRIPTDLVIPRMSEDEQLILFYEKLALLEQFRALFIKHGICAWININALHVDAILNNEKLMVRLAQLPFVEFTLCENYPLVLANFGAGVATTRSIFDRLFKRIVMDKFFIHNRIDDPSFEPFMKVIVDQVSPYCHTIIITGIDSQNARQKAVNLRYHAMQGSLWPLMEPEALLFMLPNR